MWIKKFQMYKQDFGEADEPEIRLSTLVGLWRKQESSQNTTTFASMTMQKPLTVWITRNCGKFLKRWECQSTLPVSWETGQETTIRTGHETTDWFKIGKGARQDCTFSTCLFNVDAEYIMWNARLHESQARIRLMGEISTSDMQMVLH